MKRFGVLGLAVAFAATIGCVSRPTTEVRERSSATPERARPRVECVAIPDDAQLVLERPGPREPGDCPIVLVLAEPPASAQASAETSDDDAEVEVEPEAEPIGRWVALIQLPRASEATATLEPIAIGPAPLACGPELAGCEFAGVIDERHGPIVTAAERGHESEHPVQIHLGIHARGKLAFVPSWSGPSSIVDHTRIGPAFALAPFDCAGTLRLLPAARLPEAEGETVPIELMRLAGEWVIEDHGIATPPQVADASTQGCTALLDPLP